MGVGVRRRLQGEGGVGVGVGGGQSFALDGGVWLLGCLKTGATFGDAD